MGTGATAVIRLAAVLAVTSLAGAGVTEAFDEDYHRDITRLGLTSGPKVSFLRQSVLNHINEQHEWMDAGWRNGSRSVGRDERHFDDCEFNGAADFIGDRYAGAQIGLVAANPWRASEQFGRLLHTVQDFYSHSNWVELGFPRGFPEVAQSDLVDLSGAQAPGALDQRWFALPGGRRVRTDTLGDIMLDADDWTRLPAGWTIERHGAGLFVPTLIDDRGRTVGRLLMTGEGSGDDECEVTTTSKGTDWPVRTAYAGAEHENLNKDNPKAGTHDLSETQREVKHKKARTLATLQTAYEWCRLVREAARVDRDGLLLALWVRAGGRPHAPNTPCREEGPGPTPVVVTIESVRILDSGDGGGEAGEIQLAAVLYDDPLNFRRSVHATNGGGPVTLKAGDFVPGNRLPPPMILCVPSGRGASVAVHAWDNDDDAGDPWRSEFDVYDDDDEVLMGFQKRFGPDLPIVPQFERSADLEVRFRVGRTAPGQRGVVCPPAAGR